MHELSDIAAVMFAANVFKITMSPQEVNAARGWTVDVQETEDGGRTYALKQPQPMAPREQLLPDLTCQDMADIVHDLGLRRALEGIDPSRIQDPVISCSWDFCRRHVKVILGMLPPTTIKAERRDA